jgi:hypothetical protein
VCFAASRAHDDLAFVLVAPLLPQLGGGALASAAAGSGDPAAAAAAALSQGGLQLLAVRIDASTCDHDSHDDDTLDTGRAAAMAAAAQWPLRASLAGAAPSFAASPALCVNDSGQRAMALVAGVAAGGLLVAGYAVVDAIDGGSSGGGASDGGASRSQAQLQLVFAVRVRM